MTTLDDGITALLADPANRLLHCQVIDRLQDDSADVRAELLKLVIAHRDNDGPRLAYAEWIEQNGEQTYAAFIKTQVRVAELERRLDALHSGQIAERVSLMSLLTKLRRGVADLMCVEHGPPYGVNERAWRGKAAFWGQVRPFWRRGFLEGIEQDGRQWELHHKAILAAQPVERVAIVNVHPTMTNYNTRFDSRHVLRYLIAEQVVEISERDVMLERDPFPVGDARTIAKLVCEKRWPGITFTMMT